MNTTTQNLANIPTRFKLKPLLVAIPLSILAACANNQGTTVSETQPHAERTSPYSDGHTASYTKEHETSYTEEHETSGLTTEANNQAFTGPDLTVNQETATEMPAAVAIPEQPDSSNTIEKNSTTENNSTIENKSTTEDNNAVADSTQEGSDPMTVLVIENPEILSKLASTNITQIVPPVPSHEDQTVLRPGKRVFHFGFNQTSLSEEDIELIEQHADYLKANPELQVTVHGHTDAQGNANYNLKLSQQRATMMVSELIKHGVSKDRIKSIGWGGGYPLVRSLNFAENRRIEIEYSAVHVAANQ